MEVKRKENLLQHHSCITWAISKEMNGRKTLQKVKTQMKMHGKSGGNAE